MPCNLRSFLILDQERHFVCKKDPFVKQGLPCIAQLFWVHNHPVLSADTLSYRRCPKLIRETFLGYFGDGMNVTAALNHHRNIVELNDGSEGCLEVNLADASEMPKLATVRYWYTEWRETHFSDGSIAGTIQKLGERSNEYADQGVTILPLQDPFVVVVLTGIMKRTHALPAAKEIVFVDSTACCDDQNHSVTFLLTHCPAGAVVLAVIITNSQSTLSYTAGFNLLMKAEVDKDFPGFSPPKVFMTDDSDALRAALTSVWPASLRLLCHFHIGQAVWRWLWCASHGIQKEDRKLIMNEFRAIMYEPDSTEVAELYSSASTSPTAAKYPVYQKYLSQLWERRQEWALAFRQHVFLRGHNTNNFCEANIRVFKDVVLSRFKAYNAVMLLDFVVLTLETYYRNRLRSFAHGRLTKQEHILSKLLKKSPDLISAKIVSITSFQFVVPSFSKEKGSYVVDSEFGACTCFIGSSGVFCKHQAAVLQHFGLTGVNKPATSSSDRYAIAVLALGEKAGPPNFYELLHTDGENVSVSEEMVSSETSLMDCSTQERPRSNNNSALKTADSSSEASANAGLVDRLANLHRSLAQKFVADEQVFSGLQLHLARLEKITSANQYARFLHTAGSTATNLLAKRAKSGASIMTQPTSRARRMAACKGGKRVPAGRPARSGSAPKAKRRRLLAESIKMNRPNAKSH